MRVSAEFVCSRHRYEVSLVDEDLNLPSVFVARLSQVPLVEGNATICNRSVTTTHMVGDSASSAEFFVGIAIICFLYSMVALLVYLGYMHVYKDSDFGPIFVSIHLAGELSSTADETFEVCPQA